MSVKILTTLEQRGAFLVGAIDTTELDGLPEAELKAALAVIEAINTAVNAFIEASGEGANATRLPPELATG